ncbi:hypothetical protein [Clostridium oryzae]|uniref:Uncharacterized protein n=1 Tax=Clostridium oryzae TaxID=1450648 RepID=A0A1V4IIV9_9CLOT|nr:hypothetical protein [Clostridium oryzae]OPJ59437.1 hypothetical protein CLORY_32790 [Clostridium oryzae]
MSRYSGYGDQQISNGILFIIALFFLSCAGCGSGNYGGGYVQNYKCC